MFSLIFHLKSRYSYMYSSSSSDFEEIFIKRLKKYRVYLKISVLLNIFGRKEKHLNFEAAIQYDG